jgi:hypothetical protein
LGPELSVLAYLFLKEEFHMATVIATKSFFLNSQMRDVKAGQRLELSDAKARYFTKKRMVRIMLPEPAPSPTHIRGVPRKDPPEMPAAIPPSHPELESAAEGESSKPKEDEREDTSEDHVEVDREQIVSALRERARALGVDVDGRWGEARLREEIAAARENRYNRRDMRPQE